MKYGLSKSRYCSGIQCPKMLWLKEHKPEVYDTACANQSILQAGLAVGDLAERYGIYVRPKPTEEIPEMDEITDMQISFLDILSIGAMAA